MVRSLPKFKYLGRQLFLGMLFMAALTQTRAQQFTSFRTNAAEEAALTRKAFPFLARLQQDKGLRKTISRDTVFQRIQTTRINQIRASLQQCDKASCYATSLQWSEEEIRRLGDEWINLYTTKKKFQDLVKALRKEAVYSLYGAAPDTSFLRNAWSNAAKGLNYIFDIYVKGQKPQYPKIDAISFENSDTAFRHHLQSTLLALLENTNGKPFFELPLQTAMRALQLNGRNEAIRYEPLSSGGNRLPADKLKKLNWQAYTYSMILVPGLGPEDPGVSLDSGGAKRCRDAAALYQQGLAPFLLVSGGHVHPNKTPYCEAVEMKKYLVEQLGIPESAVFIEPYARHTTTNIRNVSRMIYWLGIPSDRPVLIATDAAQNKYINQGMTKTALRDLGYLPYQNMKQLNEKQTEFYPVLTSLQVNPLDPLDP